MVIDADSFHKYVGDADGDFQKHWRHKEVVKEDPRVQKALRLQRPRQILIHIAHRLRVAQNEVTLPSVVALTVDLLDAASVDALLPSLNTVM